MTGPSRAGPHGWGWSLVATPIVAASVVPVAPALITAVVLPGAAALGHPVQVVDDPERRLGARVGGVPDGAAQVEGDPAEADAEPRGLDHAGGGIPALPHPPPHLVRRPRPLLGRRSRGRSGLVLPRLRGRGRL